MESSWSLPDRFLCYKKAIDKMQRTKRLFKDLLLTYRICLKCIFRIYSIEHVKMYNDSELFVQLLPELLGLQWGGESELKEYDVANCCIGKQCWLCCTVFQKSYLDELIKDVHAQINQKGFQQFKQFKLNIRIPNLVLLRNIILQRFIFQEYTRTLPSSQLGPYYQVLIMPLETKQFVDPKTVLKWLLATGISNSSPLVSTADDHPDNLVISLQQQINDVTSESAIVSKFCGYLGLQKKKDKVKRRKQCIDVGQKDKEKDKQQDYRCNSYNLGKIVNLKQKQFDSILADVKNISDFWMFNCRKEGIFSQPNQVTHKMTLLTKNVYLCGKYIKFSRYLSQTPWIVNGQSLTQGSLQEEIEDRIFPLFYPGKPKKEIEIKFHAGGRQDIDVRMLKGGRPFVLQLVNPILPIKSVFEEEVIKFIPQSSSEKVLAAFKKWISDNNADNKEQFHSWRITKLLELIINHGNPYVGISDFTQTTESFISIELKAAEKDKIKHYLCYIHSPQELTEQDKIKVESQKDIKVVQLTPLRVLHRRTLMSRDKLIHCLKMHIVSKRSAVLQVWASAGTYIKEFVHGDLGRTTPNIGSLIGKEVDILQLDVGSLKEGQWVQGDEKVMKMDKFAWLD